MLKLIFDGLDHSSVRFIVEEDMVFLDRWKPPGFLLAKPSQEAADEVKQLLLRTYKNFLKAWRHGLDVDSSNRVNWEEFEEACQKLGYHPPCFGQCDCIRVQKREKCASQGMSGNVAGAWRALDDDLSGFITLHEIDADASDTLIGFKKWAEEEFGGVRSAFQVFDSDGSNEVSYREFRRACRAYGFTGDVHSLFHALDVEKNGLLGLDEVEFLDGWDVTEDQFNNATGDSLGVLVHDAGLGSTMMTSDIPEYVTDGPGPAYALCGTMGAGPATPMVHFAGAYSFRRRQKYAPLPGLSRDSATFPAPGYYDITPGLNLERRSKPSWGFGSARRPANETHVKKRDEPGPGTYHPRLKSNNNFAVACAPRRPLRVHPLFRVGLH